MTSSREAELVAVRKLAEDLAQRKGERATTCHLLAAIASRPSVAADLLKERRLDVEVLLQAARVVVDDANDGVVRAIQRAREFGARSGAREAGSLHLLFALCQDRTVAAHRAMEQCGTDVSKLRGAVMQVAMGLAPPRRVVVQRTAPVPIPRSPSSLPPPPSGTRMPLGSSSASRSPVSPISPASRSPLSSRPSSPSQRPPAQQQSLPLAAPSTKSRRPKIAPNAPHATAAPAAPKPAAPGDKFALDPKVFPLLTQLGANLTLAAARGELDPVVGRDIEIDRTLDVLARRHAKNACLVGPAGVGKTSVARGIAQRIADGKDVSALDDRIVIEIEPAALLAGTAARGSLAERLAQLKAEVKKSDGKVVLFFDEVHSLFTPDAGDEAATELKVALAKGELACIGATTRDEYKRFIESDPALARRFSVVDVDEPSPEEAYLALETVAPTFEAHHKTRFAKEALAATITWSVRYIPGRALPDKAVSILDLAGARARRRGLAEVGPEQIADVISDESGVPVERLLESDGERMLRLESLLADRIVGHTAALGKIASVLRRNASGLRARRPIGSFLLLGPTGVGKTETAKAIAECLFSSPDAMTRLDLSEYAEPHAIARLVGAPPGYVGFEAGGYLTESVRRRPYQVILLDEIEKAHRDVLEAFLQVFDEGRLTDGRGRTIDFTSTVILLTSNLGADAARPKTARAAIGFGARAVSPKDEGAAVASDYEAKVMASVRAELPPELYNRIDEVLAFAPLTRSDVAEVARRMLVSLSTELESARGVRLDVSDEAVEALLDHGGFDPELGARPMRRAIARAVEAKVAEMLLRGEVSRGDIVTVEVEDGQIVLDAIRPTTRARSAG